jgi:hypothetical protein
MKMISIAPKEIYQTQQFIDDGTMMSEDEQRLITDEHIKLIGQYPTNQTEKLSRPSSISTRSEDYLAHINKVIDFWLNKPGPVSEIGFSTVLVEINNFLFTRNQVLFQGDELILMLELNRRNERYLFGSEYFSSADFKSEVILTPRTNRFLVVSAGSANWGHFLVDELPRIVRYVGSREEEKEFDFVFTSQNVLLDQNKNEIIQLLFPHITVGCTFLSKEVVYRIESAHYISPITFHPFYKNSTFLQGVRSQYQIQMQSLNVNRKKIFCLRREESRSLSDVLIEELRIIFEPLGFIFYYPAENSVKNQLALFADAEVIIGLMGAGMCNTIFSSVGTKLIYIAPEGWSEPFFWTLANSLGHEYHVFYSQTTGLHAEPEKNSMVFSPKEFFETYQNIVTC